MNNEDDILWVWEYKNILRFICFVCKYEYVSSKSYVKQQTHSVTITSKKDKTSRGKSECLNTLTFLDII